MKGMNTEMRIPTVGAAASLVAAKKALMARQLKTGKKVRPHACFVLPASYRGSSGATFSVMGGPMWSRPLRVRHPRVSVV